jgi:hypothetical protein
MKLGEKFLKTLVTIKFENCPFTFQIGEGQDTQNSNIASCFVWV